MQKINKLNKFMNEWHGMLDGPVRNVSVIRNQNLNRALC